MRCSGWRGRWCSNVEVGVDLVVPIEPTVGGSVSRIWGGSSRQLALRILRQLSSSGCIPLSSDGEVWSRSGWTDPDCLMDADHSGGVSGLGCS